MTLLMSSWIISILYGRSARSYITISIATRNTSSIITNTTIIAIFKQFFSYYYDHFCCYPSLYYHFYYFIASSLVVGLVQPMTAYTLERSGPETASSFGFGELIREPLTRPPVQSLLKAHMMHGFYSRSGQLVSGKLVSVLSFSNFRGICCRYRVLAECIIDFSSKPLRHESNVHPLHTSYDR